MNKQTITQMKKSFLMLKMPYWLVLSILFITTLHSQESKDGYDVNNYLRYENYIYSKGIKSVQLSKKSDVLSLPVVALNSKNSLLLTFDELGYDYRDYRFTIIHCDALWNPSDLRVNEYIDGYEEDLISEYQFSFNTIQPYVHYQKTFPTEDLMPTKSGNYLLLVYEDGYKDQPAFSWRFMVIETKVSFQDYKVERDRRPDYYFEKQQVIFSINSENQRISFPDRDLKVMIQQNRRWDNIKFLKPLSIKGNILVYDYYNGENSFNGVNQYRYFDIKTLKTNTMRISHSQRTEDGFDWYLLTDQIRRKTPYSNYEDIDGRFYIKTEDETDSDIESEYVRVHFFLKYDVPMHDGDFYILGDLTNNLFNDNSKMTYNYNEHGYEASLLLKQGYYNYLYAYLKNGNSIAEPEFLEGNHWETTNSYDIFVYYREPGGYYDQLIGFLEL